MLEDSSQKIGQAVGAKIREARQARGYTQQQIAHPDFSVSYISAIERGQIQPSLRALEILAQRLELNAAELLPGQNSRHELFSENNKAWEHAEEQDLAFWEACILLHRGEYQQALELILRIPTNEKKVQVQYLLGVAYGLTGQYPLCEQALEIAKQSLHDPEDPLLAAILYLQASAAEAQHNFSYAHHLREECFRWLIHTPEVPQDPFTVVRIASELGEKYGQLDLLEKAQTMLEMASSRSRKVNDTAQRLEIYRDQALSPYPIEVRSALARARWWCESEWQRLTCLQSDMIYQAGRALLASSQPDTLEKLEAFLKEASDARSQAAARVNLGTWFWQHDKQDEAAHSIAIALKLLANSGNSVILAAARLLQGEVAYANQQFLEGDEAFTAGLNMLEHVQNYAELTDQLARYADLLEQRGLIAQSLVYWKQAFEYRKKRSSEHPPYTQERTSFL